MPLIGAISRHHTKPERTANPGCAQPKFASTIQGFVETDKTYRALAASPPAPGPIVYGDNPAAGGTFAHDGVRLYYEVYGAGPPLLLIHGNGGNIWSMKNQIAFFAQHYRVIAMDRRDHGRSTDAAGPLTFEARTDDLAALLDYPHTSPVLALGWSDGAIEALLLGLRHPDKVTKIAAMAGNLYPKGVAAEFQKLQGPPPKTDPGHNPTRAERVEALDRDEPHIQPAALRAITAPSLVLASDHDAIADDQQTGARMRADYIADHAAPR